MARTGRRRSISGYYHLINRGNGRQTIFTDERDRTVFLALLKKYSEEFQVSVCAYCLMDNHIHLLVRDQHDGKSKMMQKLQYCYALYFNRKYERGGHLFQARYQSEIIDSERYLLTAFRYILRNPTKAGICPPDQYKWSSYWCYGDPTSFVNTTEIAAMLGDWERYKRFIMTESDEECLDYDNKRLTDTQAQQVIHKKFGVADGHSLQNLEQQEKKEAIHLLKESGLSFRQIERLTGFNRGMIQRA